MKIYGRAREEIIKGVKSGRVSIAVFGLGKIGLPLSTIFANKGASVIGVDINEEIVHEINKGRNPIEGEPGLNELVERAVSARRLKATTDGRYAARKADVMIIVVPTLIDDKKNIDISAIEDVCGSIAAGLERGDFVITESTLPPGTTKKVIIPILERSGLKLGEFGVAHCPERVSSGRAIEDITRAYPKIVGGADEKSTETAKALYSVINEKGVIAVSDATTAEAVKVFEGVYRDVNIALANQLAIVCEELGIDALEAFKVANTQPFCHIHAPGCGVGGHCIPVYPYFIIKIVNCDTSMLEIARMINEDMPRRTVEKLLKILDAHRMLEKGEEGEEAGEGMNVGTVREKEKEEEGKLRVLVLGLTFRGDVKETRFSPSLEIIRILRDELNAEVFAYDPLLSREEVEEFATYMHPEKAHDLDAVVIATDHKSFKEIDWDAFGERMRHKIVIDGRNLIEKAEELRKKGFKYAGIGRI